MVDDTEAPAADPWDLSASVSPDELIAHWWTEPPERRAWAVEAALKVYPAFSLPWYYASHFLWLTRAIESDVVTPPLIEDEDGYIGPDPEPYWQRPMPKPNWRQERGLGD